MNFAENNENTGRSKFGEFRFCFTLDTEPDDLWNRESATQFKHFPGLPDFHRRIVAAGARPTYLTTSEVVDSTVGRKAMERCLEDGACEVGAHVHTWTRTWPFDIPSLGFPPVQAMAHQFGQALEERMLEYTCNSLRKCLGIEIRSHRGGRWSLNTDSFRSMANCGIDVDSTILPGYSWRTGQGGLDDGADYRFAQRTPFLFRSAPECQSLKQESTIPEILEIPVGSACFPTWARPAYRTRRIRRAARTIQRNTGIRLGLYSLRPTSTDIDQLRAILLDLKANDCPVWVFMIHSSEIVPNTKLPTLELVASFFHRCEMAVNIALEMGAKPATLSEASDWLRKNNLAKIISLPAVRKQVQ